MNIRDSIATSDHFSTAQFPLELSEERKLKDVPNLLVLLSVMIFVVVRPLMEIIYIKPWFQLQHGLVLNGFTINLIAGTYYILLMMRMMPTFLLVLHLSLMNLLLRGVNASLKLTLEAYRRMHTNYPNELTIKNVRCQYQILCNHHRRIIKFATAPLLSVDLFFILYSLNNTIYSIRFNQMSDDASFTLLMRLAISIGVFIWLVQVHMADQVSKWVRKRNILNGKF